MTFICQYCNYDTERKSNWVKHIKTEKHLSNIGKTSAKGVEGRLDRCIQKSLQVQIDKLFAVLVCDENV